MELLLLCVKIFFVRIFDVSLGTVRMIVTVKGKTWLASLIGFIEVLIWFLVVKEALNTDSTSIFVALSYAGGYATGTLVGGFLSKRFISGNLGVQVVLSNRDDEIINTTNDTAIKKVAEINKDKNLYIICPILVTVVPILLNNINKSPNSRIIPTIWTFMDIIELSITITLLTVTLLTS